jgi:hypothetical protein
MGRHAGIPTYRYHKASGQGIVTLNGIDHYLGAHGTPESKAKYDRLIAEWIARGRHPDPDRVQGEMLIKELVAGHYAHITATRTPDEADKVRLALRVVRQLYGETAASKFGSVAFKAVRQQMVDAGLCITTVRQRMGVIRRLIAWGVEHEFLPADALLRIQAVEGLRARRDGVKPPRKIKPAPEADVQAVLPVSVPSSGRWSRSSSSPACGPAKSAG